MSNMDASPHPSPDDYSQYSFAALRAEQKMLDQWLAEVACKAKLIEAEIERRFGDELRAMLKAQGKESGTVSKEIDEGVKVKGSISKTVSYDTDKLKAIARDMTPEEVDHYFTVKLTMPEGIYKALPPGSLRQKVIEARSVKYGDFKVTLEDKSA